MNGPPADPFVHDDAAYVLGALSETERAEYEAHLTGCADCRARVAEIQGVPALLAGLSAADLADEPVPDTLLPGLLRRATRNRRRQRGLVAGLGLVAAACVAALVVAVWPSSSSGPAPRALHALVQVPVQADAQLVSTSWGTEIRLHCSYDASMKQSYPYQLQVVDRAGHHEVLGSWKLSPGHGIDYTAGTALRPDQIAKVQITLPNGRAILQLTNA